MKWHSLAKSMVAVRVREWMAQSYGRVTENVARGTLRGNSSRGVWLVEEPVHASVVVGGRVLRVIRLRIGKEMECEHDA